MDNFPEVLTLKWLFLNLTDSYVKGGSHVRSIHAISIVEHRRSRDLALHTWSQILCPNYGMDAYMAILFEVSLRTCIASWVEPNAIPTLSLSPAYLCIN